MSNTSGLSLLFVEGSEVGGGVTVEEEEEEDVEDEDEDEDGLGG